MTADLVDLYIIPGIAFDRRGYRLGWGQGYYDRLLAGKSAPLFGIAYHCQILDHIPHEKHDIRMNLIVTDKEVIEIPRS